MITRLTTALVLTLLLTSCKEEMVLYSHPSQSEIPDPAPAQQRFLAQNQQQSRPAAPHGDMGQRMAGGLPTPEQTNFDMPEMEGDLQAIDLKGLSFQLPADYEAADSGSMFRAAEYKVPALEDGGDGGELVVFSFGVGQGGDAAANAARWARQFTAPEGKDTTVVHYARGERADLNITRIRLFGTYAPGAMGPGQAAPEPQDNYGLAGLIVEGGPEGSLFFRLTGPEALVEAEKDSMALIAATVARQPGAANAAPSDNPHANPHGSNPHGAMNPHGSNPHGSMGSGTNPHAQNPHGSMGMGQAPHGSMPLEGAPEGSHAQVELTASGRQIVQAPGITFEVPGDWKQEQVQSSMRAGQFTVPSQGGNEGEFVIFYFGGGGGEADANIDRWVRQMGPGASDIADIQKKEINGLKVAQVHTEGTYDPGMMSGGSGPQADYGLIGVVIEGGPQGSVFLRLTGPKDMVEKKISDIDSLISSLTTK